MFDRCVRTFLNKVFQPKLPVHTVPKKIIYFSLPFTGTHSLQIRTQINRLCRAAFPHLDIRFVFRSTKRLSTFFSFKDKIPKALKSGVVYSFTCRCCSASYVGQTTRHLHTRVSEHLGITPITGKLYVKILPSPAFSHILHPQATLPLLTTLKSSPLVQMTKNSLFMKAFLSLKWNPLSTFKAVQFLFTYSDLSLFYVLSVCVVVQFVCFHFCSSLPFITLSYPYVLCTSYSLVI
jgi:hypothetical protein